MFITFKMTVKKLLLITAGAVVLFLAADTVRIMVTDNKMICKNDTQRVAYLKEQGIIAGTDPVWTKQTVMDQSGGDGWAEYAAELSSDGFDISKYYGRSVTVYCYDVKSGSDDGFVRLLTCGDEVIAFDTYGTQKAL